MTATFNLHVLRQVFSFLEICWRVFK